MATTNPRVYVGTYAKYNSGSIAGAWVDLEGHDVSTFEEACQELHGEGEHEFMFQDWEGIPEGMISESSIKAEFWDWLELDDSDKELLAIYLKHVDQDGTIEQARDSYSGTYKSEEDWAAEYLEETGMLSEVPESLRNYIDFEAYARDAGFNGMTFADVEGDVWVFNPI